MKNKHRNTQNAALFQNIFYSGVVTTGEIPPREDAFQPEQKLAELEAMLDTATGTFLAKFCF